jgi:dTDP-4-dehydrorhamnose 3,5-epimerase
MQIERAAIPDVLIIRPRKLGDERGFFSETFKQDALGEFGVTHNWVQENHAYSAQRGVVRGLHFQRPPMAQAKLLRVVRGAIFDVAVDIRAGSETYGRHVALELSAENWTQIYVPAGFAHGYCALSADTEVLYKVSAGHGPVEEGGLRWNDPALDIAWPITLEEAIVNGRDQAWSGFADFASPF